MTVTEPPAQDQVMRASELVRRTAIITFTILGILALVLLLVKVRSILLWVLIGIILAIALKPAVDWLVRQATVSGQVN